MISQGSGFAKIIVKVRSRVRIEVWINIGIRIVNVAMIFNMEINLQLVQPSMSNCSCNFCTQICSFI
jgi:hypothetical protein